MEGSDRVIRKVGILMRSFARTPDKVASTAERVMKALKKSPSTKKKVSGSYLMFLCLSQRTSATRTVIVANLRTRFVRSG